MLYGYPDNSGTIDQVCNDETMRALPSGAIELTQDQAANRWDWHIVAGDLIFSPRPSSAHRFEGGEWVLDAGRASAILQAEVTADSLRYLAGTDWYIIRKQETGEAVPLDVLAKRAAARQAVVR